MQYWNPSKAAVYRNSVVAVRKIGRDLIEKRIQDVSNGEEVPNDILTQILKMASTEKSVDLEDLVDDFVTFFFAGKQSPLPRYYIYMIMTKNKVQMA